MEHHQKFIDNLIALKSNYQELIEEYERQLTHATEQIERVNALLLDQFERQHKQQQANSRKQTESTVSNSASASTLEPPNPSPPASTASAANAFTSELSNTSRPVSLAPDLKPAVPESTQQPVIPELTQLSLKPELKKPDSSESVVSEPALESVLELADESVNSIVGDERSLQQQLEPSTANDEKRSHYVPPPTTPLLPQYQHFTTKSEAVEKFLQDNEGKIFSIDEITSAIHGDLEPVAIKAERKRMYTTLNKGVNKRFWQAVPDAPNYYTFNLNSVQPQQKADPKSSAIRKNKVEERKFRGKPATGVLPRYQNLSWSQAVETVVTEQVGQILTTDKVVRILCGDLSGEALKQAKGKISRTLWSGAKQGQWQRVPGQVGQYTLDLALVELEQA